MPPHDEDCIKIYLNAIFSEHSWVIGLADPYLRMLTKGSVFCLWCCFYLSALRNKEKIDYAVFCYRENL